jgi:GTP pyrophosphokinase
MSSATALTDRFDRAILYAAQVHGGQVRKGTSIPYAAHLLAVAATVLEYGGSETWALLPFCTMLSKIRVESRVSQTYATGSGIVSRISCVPVPIVSSIPLPGHHKENRQTRKTQYIEHLNTVDRETLLVSLADKIHNARSILRDLRKSEIGPTVWERFKNSKEKTLWYYRELANAFQKLLPGHWRKS